MTAEPCPCCGGTVDLNGFCIDCGEGFQVDDPTMDEKDDR